MKKTSVWLVLALMSLVIAAPAKEKMMGGGVAQAITALEQKWVEGSKTGNPDMVAPLLAEKFINTTSDGKVFGKGETVSHIKGAKWETNEISDVKVTVFGNTAIATGSWTGKGTDENGKAVDTHERWTDTWVKMPSGRWQCVASQGSTVKM